MSQICINPYHYKRVESPVLPPVLVPRHSEFAPGHSLLPYQQVPEPSMPHNVSFGQNGPLPAPFINTGSPGPGPAPLSPVSPLTPLSSVSSGPGPQSPFSLGPETPPPAYSPQDDKTGLCGLPGPGLDTQMDTGPVVSPGLSQVSPASQGPVSPGQVSQVSHGASVEPVAYQESEYWCSIAYYELNSRVGEVRIQASAMNDGQYKHGMCYRFTMLRTIASLWTDSPTLQIITTTDFVLDCCQMLIETQR